MRFGLKTAFTVITVFAIFLAIVANENLWLATATLGCFTGWFAVAKILQVVAVQAWTVFLLAIERRKIEPLVRLLHSFPKLFVASVLILVVIVLTNSVRSESLKISGILATWSVLLVPAIWGASISSSRLPTASEP